jgi:Holliday junction resolvasome RuvABC endonuclease subunit
MLTLPEHENQYRIIGIDPGTNTLGVAILDVCLLEGKVTLMDAFTLVSNVSVQRHQNVLLAHGERYAKLYAHSEALRKLFGEWQPNCVICESPFLGRFPQAFEALVECKLMIRRALQLYDKSMSLETVDPPTAKKAVDAPGKGGDKNAVRDAVLKLKDLITADKVDILKLDEHAIDAIAVGFFKVRQIQEWLERGD